MCWWSLREHIQTDKRKKTCTHVEHLGKMLQWVEADVVILIKRVTDVRLLKNGTSMNIYQNFFWVVFDFAADPAVFPLNEENLCSEKRDIFFGSLWEFVTAGGKKQQRNMKPWICVLFLCRKPPSDVFRCLRLIQFSETETNCTVMDNKRLPVVFFMYQILSDPLNRKTKRQVKVLQ